jgi:hypothetical protein
MPEPENLGQKILSFFIKPEAPAASAAPGANSPAASPPLTANPPSNFSPLQTPPVPAAPTLGTGTVDSKFAEHLAQVLAKINQPGPDYFEFRGALQGLAGLGLGEEKQFQAAWASFKAMGGMPEVAALSRTGAQYLAALSADRDGFAKSVDAALSERVGGLQAEQQRLQAENDNLAKQIADMQQRLAANTTRLTAIATDSAEQTSRLTQSRQNYEATYAHFTQQIKDDLSKISQYLQ